jgi:hypothetical protein
MPLPNLTQLGIASILNERMTKLGYQFKTRSGDYIRGSGDGYFLIAFENVSEIIIFCVSPEGITDCSDARFDFILEDLDGYGT